VPGLDRDKTDYFFFRKNQVRSRFDDISMILTLMK